MMYYAVIDTNVIVSAMLKQNSVPGNIVGFIFNGIITPPLNDDIMKEYKEVLIRPKFHLDEGIINEFLSEINSRGININAEKLDINFPDPKDAVFYEIVMEERKTEYAYLVTGNIKHFPEKSFVVTPKQMLDIIVENIDGYS